MTLVLPSEPSQAEFRLLFDALPHLAWVLGPAGETLYYNVRWRDYAGVAPLEMHDQTTRRGTVHPDDSERSLTAWRECFERGVPAAIEMRFRRADGTWRAHLATINPVRGADGAITHWIGTATDIEAQKRAEERQAYLAEAAAVLSSTLDVERTLRSLARLAVPRVADWCSIMTADESPYLRSIAVAHAQAEKLRFAETYAKRFPTRRDNPIGAAEVLRTGKSQLHVDIPLEALREVAHGDEHFEILKELDLRSVLLVPVLVDGQPYAVMTFVGTGARPAYDATDLAFAEDLARRAGLAVANARMFQDLQAADQAKSDFLATLSHELRTPLNVLNGWIDLLLAGDVGADELSDVLLTLKRNVRTQSRLIEDLLDTSRILAGRMTIAVRATDLKTLVVEAVAALRPEALAKDVALSCEAEDVGRLAADPERLRQALANLLGNAVKFTEPGGIVRVTLRKLASDAVQFCVSDSGKGIAPEFLPFVFDRFRQEDGGLARRHGGLGLGLAIVKHIVELHGGFISATSDGLGHGARFTVTLPAKAAEQPATHGVRSVSASAAHGRLTGLRVLLVEDEPDTRLLVTRVLKRAGATVESVGSAAEALATLPTFRPDAIVSDIGMVGTDGLMLIRQIRERAAADGGDVPAVALTAYAAPEQKQDALDAGFQLHLAKPVSPMMLIDAVARLKAAAPAQLV